MAEKYYEMLWDCAACGARGLLAKSQKHCPLCGSVQDPEKRYFPLEDQEIEVQGHCYVGADWHCAYCQSPNAALAAFCANCGASKEEGRTVGRKPSPHADSTPSPAVPVARRHWMRWMLLLLVLGGGFLVLRFLWKTEEPAKVVSLDWRREIDIERYLPVNESAWCEDLPAGAYSIRRSQEVRGHKKIADGETCREIKADQGDGTFIKKRECAAKYREVPLMAEKCHYRIDRWQKVRTETAQGRKETPARWPEGVPIPRPYANMPGSAPAKERQGARRELLTMQGETARGEHFSCPLTLAVWSRLAEGTSVLVQRRASGGVVCDGIGRP